jgi:hypothetical protein
LAVRREAGSEKLAQKAKFYCKGTKKSTYYQENINKGLESALNIAEE